MVVLSTVFEGDGAQFMQHNKYVAAHVDLLWDVTNFWAPYRESKVFRLIPWVGFGYAQRFKTTESYDRPRTESPTLNAGILTAFRLSKRVDLNVEIQGSLLNEQFNRVEMNHLTDGIVQLSAGLTFKLGKDRLRGIGADGLRFVERRTARSTLCVLLTMS